MAIRILFMGRKPVAAKALRWLVDDPRFTIVGVATDDEHEKSPTAAIARDAGLRLFDFDDLLKGIGDGSLSYDLGISMFYWRKLKGGLLDAPPLGTINFHPAPLPAYKGVGGYNLAILDGLDRWGATAHYVDAQIDTGPIVERVEFPIDRDTMTPIALEAMTQEKIFALFGSTMEKVAARDGPLPSEPNVGGRLVTLKMLDAMKRVDFDKDDVARKVRAFWFPPYDGAYIESGGQRYTLADRDILAATAGKETQS